MQPRKPKADRVLDYIQTKNKEIRALRAQIAARKDGYASDLQTVALEKRKVELAAEYDVLLEKSAKVKERFRQLDSEVKAQRKVLATLDIRSEAPRDDTAVWENHAKQFKVAKFLLESMRTVRNNLLHEKSGEAQSLTQKKLEEELSALLKEQAETIKAIDDEKGIFGGTFSDTEKLTALAERAKTLSDEIQKKEDQMQGEVTTRQEKIRKFEKGYATLMQMVIKNDLIHARRTVGVSIEDHDEQMKIISDLDRNISECDAMIQKAKTRLSQTSSSRDDERKKYDALYAEYSKLDAELRTHPIVEQTKKVGEELDDVEEKLQERLKGHKEEVTELEKQISVEEARLKEFQENLKTSGPDQSYPESKKPQFTKHGLFGDKERNQVEHFFAQGKKKIASGFSRLFNMFHSPEQPKPNHPAPMVNADEKKPRPPKPMGKINKMP
jgi:hypothetical protein